jgi:hypothetical protein
VGDLVLPERDAAVDRLAVLLLDDLQGLIEFLERRHGRWRRLCLLGRRADVGGLLHAGRRLYQGHRLCARLDSAKQTILIQAYSFTLAPIAKALLEALDAYS